MESQEKLFIMELMEGNESFCKKVLKVTQDPTRLKILSDLFSYVYSLGMTENLDNLLP